MKFKWLLIFVIMIFFAGTVFYYGFDKQDINFQKFDINDILSEVKKEIFAPPPLDIGGLFKPVVLLQSKIISETNLQRQENGNLVSLKENTTLDKIASAKANDMFLNQYFDHISPSGIGPGDLAQKHGYEYILEGENLILGNFSSEKDVIQNWMNSPGHRANILNNRYSEIGVAIIKGKYKGQSVWIGVQEFGLPLSACSQPDSNLKKEIEYNRSQLDNMFLQINQEKDQIDSTNFRSANYRQMVNDYNQLISQYNSLAEITKNVILQYNNQVNIFNNCVAGN